MQFNPFMTGMLVSVAIASISQVLLKKSTFVHYQSIIKEYINPYVIGGYGLLFISMLLTVYAYSGLQIWPCYRSVWKCICFGVKLYFL